MRTFAFSPVTGQKGFYLSGIPGCPPRRLSPDVSEGQACPVLPGGRTTRFSNCPRHMAIFFKLLTAFHAWDLPEPSGKRLPGELMVLGGGGDRGTVLSLLYRGTGLFMCLHLIDQMIP